MLFFTKSSGFEHPQVKRKNGGLAPAERTLIEIGKRHGFEVEASKDGRVFDGRLDRFDAFVFYTSGDLTKKGTDGQPPMSAAGKKALLDAIAGGKGFAGIHSTSDTFHSSGPRNKNQKTPDPFIAMLGGEFITHGPQHKAALRCVDPHFPGIKPVGRVFELHEEWYALKNFAPDLHVILVQETRGMRGAMYARPPYPNTWARNHGKGRVFYTAMGHRADVWANPLFQSILAGGVRWAMGHVRADTSPNLATYCPEASRLPG